MYSHQKYYKPEISIDPLQIEQTKLNEEQLDQSHEIMLSDDDSILSLDSDLENYSNHSWSQEHDAKPNNSLLKQLSTWIDNYNISVPAVNDLLKILSKHGIKQNLSSLTNRPDIPLVGSRKRRLSSHNNNPEVETTKNRSFEINDNFDISGRLDVVEQKIDMHQITTQQILDNQSSMQQTLNLILEKLPSNRHAKIEMPDDFQYEYTLPITTIEMLEEYETKLRTFPEFKNKMIQLLSQSGGPDAKKTARSIVRAMIIDDVLVNYSWTGTNTKRVFSSFREINSTIVGTMRQRFPNYTDYDNATFFKQYLKHASSRVVRHDNSNKIL